AADVSAWLVERPWPELCAAAARTRASFDPSLACRLGLVLEKETTEPARLAARAVSLLAQQGDWAAWSTPERVHFGRGRPGGLALLFPGQGSQYVGMARDLACQFPHLLDALAAADSGFESRSGRRLSDLIYPHPAFDDPGRTRQEEALRATDV